MLNIVADFRSNSYKLKVSQSMLVVFIFYLHIYFAMDIAYASPFNNKVVDIAEQDSITQDEASNTESIFNIIDTNESTQEDAIEIDAHATIVPSISYKQEKTFELKSNARVILLNLSSGGKQPSTIKLGEKSNGIGVILKQCYHEKNNRYKPYSVAKFETTNASIFSLTNDTSTPKFIFGNTIKYMLLLDSCI